MCLVVHDTAHQGHGAGVHVKCYFECSIAHGTWHTYKKSAFIMTCLRIGNEPFGQIFRPPFLIRFSMQACCNQPSCGRIQLTTKTECTYLSEQMEVSVLSKGTKIWIPLNGLHASLSLLPKHDNILVCWQEIRFSVREMERLQIWTVDPIVLNCVWWSTEDIICT